MSGFITDFEEAGALTGVEVIEIAQLSTAIAITASTISAQASDNSFNDSGSGFVAAGFAEGDRVNVAGFTGDTANNIRVGTIETLAAGKMTIASPNGDVIVDDAAGESVTISKWVTRRILYSSGGASSLDDLSDVEIDAPADGDTLIYDASLGAFINAEPAASAGGYIAETDPAGQWFGPSDTILVTPSSGTVGGDPHVVPDPDAGGYVMFYWEGSGLVCRYKTAPSILGPWSAATTIAGMANHHKPFILVDEDGVPVKIGGTYHAYASYFGGGLAGKKIVHFTASTLTGTWTLQGDVITKGASTDKDGYNTDTPFALYKGGTVYLWYMGAPTASVTDFATYGYAIRMLRATASDPAGAFTKETADVIAPAASAAWNYGWMGGVQVFKRPGGGYMMVYNAGDTRPSGTGLEPNTSRAGYAYSDSLDGPWTDDASNPIFDVDNEPSDALEETNHWRTMLIFEPQIRRWVAFYNCGTGPEVTTYAVEGIFDYFRNVGSPAYNVQTLTTSIVAVTDSRRDLLPGVYRVRYMYNLMASDTGSTPSLDVDSNIRVNGTAIGRPQRDYVGNYAFENINVENEHVVHLGEKGYVDLAVQVTGGTPIASSRVRRLRVMVERIG